MYKDRKSGGSVITERLYIDIKQDLKIIKKKKKTPFTKTAKSPSNYNVILTSKPNRH